jgi:glycyl-tRNA synthetase beta chain
MGREVPGVDGMTDFLLELRCEEIPARMQEDARTHLQALFVKNMKEAGVAFGEMTAWSTPRRLALIVRDLPEVTEAVSEELKGPKVGAPEQALEGFLRKTGLAKNQLVERDGVYFAVTEKPGRAVRDVLAETIPTIIRHFGWPKSMRWGAASLSTESTRWVRPLSGIVAIFGEDLVECATGGVTSSYATKGHRFHHPGEITIGSASDYAEKLRACHVIVNHEERQDIIRTGAAKVAAEAGLVLVEDEGLVIENAGLTEYPDPLLGRFDEAFLEVPPEVIQLTARTNQKYFICRDKVGKLANAFICTANIVAQDDGAAIVDGNRKVLAARLSDARFFWQQDRRKTLAQHAEGLARITFHEKLGTVADKVERVAKLARWLVEEGIVQPSPPLGGEGRGGAADEGRGGPSSPADAALRGAAPLSQPSPPKGEGYSRAELADLAEQAARLAKADLVTEMVGEFPELQGLMGGYYARAEGLPDEVADAIRDHYKPVGQGDEVPTAPLTVAVSLADKLDTLAGFFAEEMPPSGSRDPFALRRAALGVIGLVLQNQLRIPLLPAFFVAAGEVTFRHQKSPLERIWPTIDALAALKTDLGWKDMFDPLIAAGTRQANEEAAWFSIRAKAAAIDLLDFFADRLKVQQREAGVRHDLIDAVFALGGEDDLVRLLARVKALQSFIATQDGANLLAGYKRAANILKKEDWQGIEGEIPLTGEEDPLAEVDDPDLAAVVAAKMAERHAKVLSYTPEKAEQALIDALAAAGPKADAAIAAEDFEGAMAALATLRAPIDTFFDEVTVNDEDKEKRAARLELLAQFRAAVHKVADFSKIEG